MRARLLTYIYNISYNQVAYATHKAFHHEPELLNGFGLTIYLSQSFM